MMMLVPLVPLVPLLLLMLMLMPIAATSRRCGHTRERRRASGLNNMRPPSHYYVGKLKHSKVQMLVAFNSVTTGGIMWQRASLVYSTRPNSDTTYQPGPLSSVHNDCPGRNTHAHTHRG